MKILIPENREGASLWLEKHKDTWILKVDSEHLYCLEYMKVLGEFDSSSIGFNIEAIDPSGGPLISLGDVVGDKYKIIEFLSPTILKLSEKYNDN